MRSGARRFRAGNEAMSLPLNILSGILTLAGFVPYVASILKGKTKPNRVTWWIWCAAGFLLMSTYYSLGARAGLGMAIGSFAGQTLVSALTLRYGTGGT